LANIHHAYRIGSRIPQLEVGAWIATRLPSEDKESARASVRNGACVPFGSQHQASFKGGGNSLELGILEKRVEESKSSNGDHDGQRRTNRPFEKNYEGRTQAKSYF
jgi:hypothetical protein